MIKIRLVLCYILLTSFQESSEVGTFIKWSKESKIKWEDFQGKSIENTSLAAASVTGIMYSVFSASFERYVYEVNASFNKKYSWAWQEKSDAYGLAHEQGHFDIAEIYTRKFRKELSQNRYTYPQIEDQIFMLYNKYLDSLNLQQDTYDTETLNSMNVEKQKLWNEKIKTDLKSLEKYANPFVRVYLKNE